MQKTLNKFTAGFGLAVAISIIFNALLVIAKETNKWLKDILRTLLGHHWITHGVITIVLFLVLGFLLSQLRVEESWGINARKLLIIVLSASILGGLIINIFYLLHL